MSPAPQHSQTLRRPPSERALRRFELLQRNRPCPSPGCNFRVTWHDTHCCNRCASGRGHGTHCDRDTVPSPSELDEQSHYDDLSMGFSATSELEEALDAKEEELQTAKQTAMAYIQELLGEKKELHAERRRLIARLKNLESGEEDAEAARRREEDAARQRREVRTALEGKAEAEERARMATTMAEQLRDAVTALKRDVTSRHEQQLNVRRPSARPRSRPLAHPARRR